MDNQTKEDTDIISDQVDALILASNILNPLSVTIQDADIAEDINFMANNLLGIARYLNPHVQDADALPATDSQKPTNKDGVVSLIKGKGKDNGKE